MRCSNSCDIGENTFALRLDFSVGCPAGHIHCASGASGGKARKEGGGRRRLDQMHKRWGGEGGGGVGRHGQVRKRGSMSIFKTARRPYGCWVTSLAVPTRAHCAHIGKRGGEMKRRQVVGMVGLSAWQVS